MSLVDEIETLLLEYMTEKHNRKRFTMDDLAEAQSFLTRGLNECYDTDTKDESALSFEARCVRPLLLRYTLKEVIEATYRAVDRIEYGPSD